MSQIMTSKTEKTVAYLNSTMEMFVSDILICWKWRGINHKQALLQWWLDYVYLPEEILVSGNVPDSNIFYKFYKDRFW